MRELHVVLPDAARDPRRPSGGNHYDVRVCDGLAGAGWHVIEHAVTDSWPVPGAAPAAALTPILEQIPSGAVVLVDGLIASAAASALLPQARRLALVVLMHMPTWDEQEAAVLSEAVAVVATSRWTRDQLIARHALPDNAVHVAEPGVDAAQPATGDRGTLLNVAAVSTIKGQDVLVSALARLREIPGWQCRCVGPLDREPEFTTRVREQAADSGIARRISFAGPLHGNELAAAYCGSELAVFASRSETFGMTVTESLAHGLPVIATDTGGVPEALGDTALGPPGVLVRPEDDLALAEVLRAWLEDQEFRTRLQAAARERRATLIPWHRTVERIDRLLGVIPKGGERCRS